MSLIPLHLVSLESGSSTNEKLMLWEGSRGKSTSCNKYDSKDQLYLCRQEDLIGDYKVLLHIQILKDLWLLTDLFSVLMAHRFTTNVRPKV